MYFKYIFLLGAYIYICVCVCGLLLLIKTYSAFTWWDTMKHLPVIMRVWASLYFHTIYHIPMFCLSVPSRLRPKPLSPPSYFQFFLSTFPPSSTPNLIKTFCEANKYCQRNCFYNYCRVGYNVSLFLENVSGKLLLSKIVSTRKPFF